MDPIDQEGSAVLERLAASGRLDAFADAVDRDDVDAARALMIEAGVEPETIARMVRAMLEP